MRSGKRTAKFFACDEFSALAHLTTKEHRQHYFKVSLFTPCVRYKLLPSFHLQATFLNLHAWLSKYVKVLEAPEFCCLFGTLACVETSPHA